LPLEHPLPLVAQVGQKGNPTWLVVGRVVRRREGLEATFTAQGTLCEPAWAACLESAYRGSFLQDVIRFGVVTERGVVLIAEGEISSTVVRQSQVLARRFAGLADTQGPERGRREQDLRRFLRGGGPPRLRSGWPRR
jgi:hypothetical protein